MAIDKALYTLLKGYVSNRVYPLGLPENPTYPAITYRQLSHQAHPVVNVSYPTFQVDLWTTTYQANVELRDTIVAGVDRKKTITDGYDMRMHYLNYVNFFDNDTKLFHGVIDFEVFYKEG
jgi:hypothetical protein